jgi:AcrR family transcriptional regulator
VNTEEGRRERKKRARRSRIYETARQLFLEHGVTATTVEQIAEAADVAPTTFFNHFQSKSAVLGEMVGEVSDHLHAMLESELATAGTADEHIRRFATDCIKALSLTEGLARDVLLEMLRTASGPGKVLPYLARVHEPFVEILRRGRSEGNVRRDIEPDILAELVVGVLNTALVGWLNDGTYPLAERLTRFSDVIGELIGPQAGRR